MNSRKLLADLINALLQLQNALGIPPDHDVIKAGCIQYFEFSFELAWKTIKRIAEDEGLSDCNSPKAALRTAFSNHWIDAEDIWLEMLAARNRMSHTYSAEDAIDIFERLPAFAKALQQLTEKTSELLADP